MITLIDGELDVRDLGIKPSLIRTATTVTPLVDVFGPPTSKFVFVCLAQMVCSEDTRVYTGWGGMSLRLVYCCSCYQHLICSRGYKLTREEKDPKSLVKGVNGC